jgi:cbb3-type cytochrome oxidase subunit 1
VGLQQELSLAAEHPWVDDQNLADLSLNDIHGLCDNLGVLLYFSTFYNAHLLLRIVANQVAGPVTLVASFVSNVVAMKQRFALRPPCPGQMVRPGASSLSSG